MRGGAWVGFSPLSLGDRDDQPRVGMRPTQDIGMITTIISFMIKIRIVMIMIATMTMMTIVPMNNCDQ